MQPRPKRRRHKTRTHPRHMYCSRTANRVSHWPRSMACIRQSLPPTVLRTMRFCRSPCPAAPPQALPVSISNSHLESAATQWRLLSPFTDTIIAANGSQISSRNSYAGALITGVNQTDPTHATLTLLLLSPRHYPPIRPRSTPSASTSILRQQPSAPPTLLSLLSRSMHSSWRKALPPQA